MRRALTLLAVLFGLLTSGPARADSRDLEAQALQGMCRSTRPGKADQDRLGCGAFIDGFVRGLTRGKRCPVTDYEPVLNALLEEPPERLGKRRSDEVIEELVTRIHPCGT